MGQCAQPQWIGYSEQAGQAAELASGRHGSHPRSLSTGAAPLHKQTPRICPPPGNHVILHPDHVPDVCQAPLASKGLAKGSAKSGAADVVHFGYRKASLAPVLNLGIENSIGCRGGPTMGDQDQRWFAPISVQGRAGGWIEKALQCIPTVLASGHHDAFRRHRDSLCPWPLAAKQNLEMPGFRTNPQYAVGTVRTAGNAQKVVFQPCQ